ncbi:MAG: T9SS type A sorting domain-containing protein [Bacteroidia bacterium]
MKNLLPSCINLLITLLFTFSASAQEVSNRWAIGLGDAGNTNEKSYCIANDHSGNIFITGKFESTVSFGTTTPVDPLISVGMNDVFLIKYDSVGNHIWSQSLGGKFDDEGLAIAIDNADNIYVTGSFQDTAYFDYPYNSISMVASTGSDVFVAKYDSSGNLIWASSIIGTGEDVGKSIVIGNDGYVYLSGYFSDSLIFVNNGIPSGLSSAGGKDFFIAKYDTSGNSIWAKGIGGQGNDLSYSMIYGSNGYLYLTGVFEDTADFNPGIATANLISSGNTDIFLAKYDTAGNYTWAKKMGGSGADSSHSITFYGESYIYMTGGFGGTSDFDPSGASALLTSWGNQNMFFAKYDTAGNYFFAERIGSISSLSTISLTGLSIASDDIGSYYITGRSSGKVDFDPAPLTSHMFGSGRTFLAKYDSAGAFVWMRGPVTDKNDVGQFIIFNGKNSVYYTGFGAAMRFDNSAHFVQLKGQQLSPFVAKYSLNGLCEAAWSVKEYGYNQSSGDALATDAEGNVYIAGAFSGMIDFDPSLKTHYLMSEETQMGRHDAYIGKYTSSGELLWAKRMGNIWNDYVVNIAFDDSGYVYLGGYLHDSIDNTRRMFIKKLDTSGNFIWSILIGGNLPDYSNHNRPQGFAMDDDNNIYVAGNFRGTKDFDPSSAVANLTAPTGNGADIFLAKYNSSGQYQWAHQLNGVGEEEIRSMYYCSSGIYIVGTFNGTLDFDPSVNSAQFTSNAQDIFITKYDTAGKYLWAKIVGGDKDDKAIGSTIGINGDIYLYGHFTDSTDIDPSPVIASFYSPAGGYFYSYFMAKYDSTGNYIWGRNMEMDIGSKHMEIHSSNNAIYTDQKDNIYLTGGFRGTVDFDPSGNNAYITSKSNNDMYFAKYDSAANYMWAKPIGVIYGYQEARAIVVQDTGIIYLTGLFTHTVDFSASPRIANFVTPNVYPSIFLAKYTNCEISQNNIFANGCDSFISPSGEYIWTTSGVYSDTLLNSSGCDSIITVNLTINQITDSSIQIFFCDSFISPSNKYIWNSSGIYTDTLLNALGCDSVISVNLTIIPRTTSAIHPTACDSFISPSSKYIWNSSGTYTDTLLNALGCDSVITINLTIRSSYNSINPVVCDSFISPSNRYIWKSNGSYTDTIPNFYGCDSIITIGLTINNSSIDSYSTVACDSLYWPVTGITYYSSDTLMAVFQNAIGCDSIIKLYLTITNSTFSSISPVVCDSFVSPSGKYVWTTTGNYTDTIPNFIGCDSIISVNLTLDSDCVWPGDANSDGVANNFDILAIGTQYSKTGPTRANSSISWTAQHASDWSDTLANGANIKHADCDGSGTISAADTTAVSVNYNKTHNKTGLSKLGGPDDPVLSVKFQQDSLTAGMLMKADIHFGSDIQEAEDVYGIAYTVSVPAEFIEPNSLMLNYHNSWLGNVGSELIYLNKSFNGNGEVETAISRINHSNVSGSGKIGVIQFRLKDPLPQTALSHLKVELKDVLLINATETPLPYNLEGDSIRFVTGIAKTYIYNRVVIYPNPTKDEVSVNFTGLHVNEIQILDLRGRTMLVKKLRSADFTVEGKEVLNTSNLAAGVYLVKVMADEGVIQKRVVILNSAP